MLRFLRAFYVRGAGRRIDWLIELFFVAVGFGLLLSFISASSWDNAWHTTSPFTTNLLGTTGAWSTDVLFFLFGVSALFIPFFFIRLSFIEDRLKRALFFVFLLFTFSTTLSLFFNLITTDSFVGGLIGYSLGYSLNLLFTMLGLDFVSFFAVLGGFVLSAFLFLNSFAFTFKDVAYAEQKCVAWLRSFYVLFKQKLMPMSPAPNYASAPRTPKKLVQQKLPLQRTVAPMQVPKRATFQLPPVSLLQDVPTATNAGETKTMQMQNAKMLEHFFAEFKVEGSIKAFHPGPVVTLYEFEPSSGTKTSKVVSLAEDVARSMSLDTLRIAPLPGTNRIGVELPNMKRQIVYLKKSLNSGSFKDVSYSLPIILGSDIGGDTVVVPLEKMPHLLVAGRTGSGKSVFIRTVILSLLYRLKPEECRLILIDPKMLEFKDWDDIPHLLTPVVTNPNEAVNTLKWAVREMEERYRKMALLRVKNLEGYNKTVNDILAKKQVVKHRVKVGVDSLTGRPQYEERPIDLKPYPYLVIIIDELADLMLVAGKEVEASIQRLAQMARASGIHLIMATQRPSVNVITGVIKANFPTRISFQVSSKIDSRTILERQGAEQLLDHGDMLYMAAGRNPVRVHAPFATEKEAQKVAEFLKAQEKPKYIHTVVEEKTDQAPSVLDQALDGGREKEDHELYEKAVQVVIESDRPSTSYVQRQLRIGYNRAATLIEQMEDRGVISAPNTSGKRTVLVKKQ
ncbi:MAG: DNA translocase FtsK 4TM domain-containing protein [Alphaproteobacteria bacterium]|nr:DNA translocase FtsK 4TM domain-containing protein [Alphaproteobacteria bacterium]MBN2779437.1 DNA translocase FtsK 4TM domain-containing protein [Alphaproteobacteria bacterium]